MNREEMERQLRKEERYRGVNKDDQKEMLGRIKSYLEFWYNPKKIKKPHPSLKIQAVFTLADFDILLHALKLKSFDKDSLAKATGLAPLTLYQKITTMKTNLWKVSRREPIKERLSKLYDWRRELKEDDRRFKHISNDTQHLFGLGLIETFVLVYRFGLLGQEKKTLRDIGNVLKVTPERIRQREAKALRKLRHPSRKDTPLATMINEACQGMPR